MFSSRQKIIPSAVRQVQRSGLERRLGPKPLSIGPLSLSLSKPDLIITNFTVSWREALWEYRGLTKNGPNKTSASPLEPNWVNMRGFKRIRRKLMEVWETKLVDFYKKCMLGAVLWRWCSVYIWKIRKIVILRVIKMVRHVRNDWALKHTIRCLADEPLP